MVRPFLTAVVRYGVVYATTGVFGLGVLAWMAYRSRRSVGSSPASGDRRTYYDQVDMFDLGAAEV